MIITTKQKITQKTKGEWFTFEDKETEQECQLLIKPANNPAFVQVWSKAATYNEAQAERLGNKLDMTYDPDFRTPYDVQCETLAYHLVEDWNGVVDADGNAVEFDPELLYTTMLFGNENKPNIKLFNFILAKSGEVAEKTAKEFNDTVKK